MKTIFLVNFFKTLTLEKLQGYWYNGYEPLIVKGLSCHFMNSNSKISITESSDNFELNGWHVPKFKRFRKEVIWYSGKKAVKWLQKTKVILCFFIFLWQLVSFFISEILFNASLCAKSINCCGVSQLSPLGQKNKMYTWKHTCIDSFVGCSG